MLTDYRASEEELQDISEWVAEQSLMSGFDDHWHQVWHFVPEHLYDPIDYELSRQRAVVIYENDPENGQFELRRTLP